MQKEELGYLFQKAISHFFAQFLFIICLKFKTQKSLKKFLNKIFMVC
jgi:hypothetical protein